MQIKNTSDLRGVLLETIEQVRTQKMGTKEATAIATLSARVMQSAELDLKAARYAEQYGGDIRSSTPLIPQSTERKRK